MFRVTDAVPGETSSAAGTIADSCPELTNVVWSAVPFQVTSTGAGVSEGKFAPRTVSVKVGLPACAELGDRLVRVGALEACITVKVSELETELPSMT